MKHRLLLPLLIFLMALTGCKTTEKNYRAAYERTVNSDNEYNVTDFDKTIYGRHRNAVRDAKARTSDNRMVDTKVIVVAVTEGGGGIPEWLKRYSVCVGAFKQLFNAKSLQSRLADAGYPRTFIVHNAEPYYYILIDSSDNLDKMNELAEKYKANPALPLKEGMPFILQVSRR